MPKRNAPPTRTSEEWRAIARSAARLALILADRLEEEEDDDEEEQGGHPDPMGEALGRAAELLVQSGLEKMDPKQADALEEETALLIATGGYSNNGWEAAREALKRAGEG